MLRRKHSGIISPAKWFRIRVILRAGSKCGDGEELCEAKKEKKKKKEQARVPCLQDSEHSFEPIPNSNLPEVCLLIMAGVQGRPSFTRSAPLNKSAVSNVPSNRSS